MSLTPKEQGRLGTLILGLVLAVLVSIPLISKWQDKAACQDFKDNYRAYVLRKIDTAELDSEVQSILWRRYNTSAHYEAFRNAVSKVDEWRSILTEIDSVGVDTYTSQNEVCN